MGNNESRINTFEAAKLLGMTQRRIVGLCNEGKIPGAIKMGKSWSIPMTALEQYGIANDIEISAPSSEKKGLLPLAIGNTSYIEISTECYYVDKTLLIRDLIDDHNKVTLFTRPRRFGKTLTIDMIKTFFEKTDRDTSQYFTNQKIWQCGSKYQKLQGAYPVIMLTFKDVKYNNWDNSLEAIRLVIKDEYKRHSELIDSPFLDDDVKDYIARLEKGSLTDVELQRSLHVLSSILSIHYKTKTVILIDEYDIPIQQGFTHKFYSEVVSFMRNFLSGGLKDNDNLAFGVLTGIMRVSKENLFSGLNNPLVNTVLDEKYSEYFGFTNQEVMDMVSYYHSTANMEDLRYWYDGYHFGKMDIYNPWSITNYFASGGVVKPYWANTSDNVIIQDILSELTPDIAEDLVKVMQEEIIHVSLDMEVVYPRITDGSDTIFSFLLQAGYLTTVGQITETEFGTFASLRLPNAEIKRIYNSEVLSWIRTKNSDNTVSEIEKSIYLNDEIRLQKALRNYMITTISFFDGAAEGFYHGMVLGLVACLSSKYYIQSNREAGDGRFDLHLVPKDRQLPGILMEFKAASHADRDQLRNLADEAINQINKNHYYDDLRNQQITNIVKYGIAFSGKNVEVKIEK